MLLRVGRVWVSICASAPREEHGFFGPVLRYRPGPITVAVSRAACYRLLLLLESEAPHNHGKHKQPPPPSLSVLILMSSVATMDDAAMRGSFSHGTGAGAVQGTTEPILKPYVLPWEVPAPALEDEAPEADGAAASAAGLRMTS